MRGLARGVDALLEASVVGSYSRFGIACRRRLEHWGEPPRLEGSAFIVTGASSGIGRAAAVGLARLGAAVCLLGRDSRRTEATRKAVLEVSGAGEVETSLLDVVDSEAVAEFAERFADRHGRLDGIVHNAGALFPRYQTTAGVELTVATHVLAPFRLNWLLGPMLRSAGGSVIVTVASGGMYAERFDLGRLEMSADTYRGVTAYARAKRAQVVLAHEWGRRWGLDGVASYSSHPGWVDTPGLAAGLPAFARLGPLLRSPEEGADTIVWLAAGGALPIQQEGFWHDRKRRGEYRLPGTAPTAIDRAEEGARLWDWCAARTGLGATSGSGGSRGASL